MGPKKDKAAKKGKGKEKKKGPDGGGTSTAKVSAPALPPGEMSFEGCLEQNWLFFKQKFAIFLEAGRYKDQPEPFKLSLLLNTIGDRGLQVYNNLTFDPRESKESYSTVVRKFDDYFARIKNVTYERYLFFSRDQRVDETIESYLDTLRSLAAPCEFDYLTEGIVRDKAVHGINNSRLRQKLLNSPDLTINKILDTMHMAEFTSIPLCTTPCSRRTSSCDERSNVSCYDYPFLPPDQRSMGKVRKSGHFPCKNCGTFHGKLCPAAKTRCVKCNNFNHFANMCSFNIFVDRGGQQGASGLAKTPGSDESDCHIEE